MTDTPQPRYCPWFMEAWQSRAAFVIHFREDTDIEAGRIEGKVEHIASFTASRFRSLDELLGFVARILAEGKDRDQTVLREDL